MHHHCAHASWIVLISLFLVFLLHFLFVLCVRVSWLSISCLLHVKYSLSHRIRSYVRVNYTGHRIICPRYHQGTSDLQTLWHYNVAVSTVVIKCTPSCSKDGYPEVHRSVMWRQQRISKLRLCLLEALQKAYMHASLLWMRPHMIISDSRFKIYTVITYRKKHTYRQHTLTHCRVPVL